MTVTFFGAVWHNPQSRMPTLPVPETNIALRFHMADFSVARTWLILGVLIGCASQAKAHPSAGIVVDQDGNVYFCDNGGDGGPLWKIDAAGKLSRAHDHGWHWLALDEKGGFQAKDLKTWWDQRITMNFSRVPLAGGKRALLQADGAPFVIARDGNLYWGNLDLKKLTPAGEVTTFADQHKDSIDELGGIKGFAAGPDGSLYASCPSAILRFGQDGRFEIVFHRIMVGDADWDWPAGVPDEYKPYLRGLAVNSGGTVYAAATGARKVVRVTPQGNKVHVDVVMKAEKPWSPTGVAVYGDDVYVLEYTNPNSEIHDEWMPRVRKLARDGKVTTLATISEKDREP
jgi:hypothetical protein